MLQLFLFLIASFLNKKFGINTFFLDYLTKLEYNKLTILDNILEYLYAENRIIKGRNSSKIDSTSK